jgi:hypothetical protein
MSNKWEHLVASAPTPENAHERPGTADAVEAIVAKVAPILSARKITRADAHRLVDALYDLAPHAGHVGAIAEGAARAAGQALAAGTFGWTELPFPECAPDWDSLTEVPELWRLEFVYRLGRTPHVLPEGLTALLIAALSDLNRGDGHIPQVISPSIEQGYGRNPREARNLEEWLWCWIACKHVEGEKVWDLIAKVAGAVGRTSKAVEAWRTAWIKRDGAEAVDAALDYYKCSGHRQSFFRDVQPMEELAASWVESRRPAKTVQHSST